MLEAAIVKAKPADVLKKQPFVLQKEAPKYTGEFDLIVFSRYRCLIVMVSTK